GRGGGIYSESTGVTLNNTTVSGNSADASTDGSGEVQAIGGIFVGSNPPAISGSTVGGNIATASGSSNTIAAGGNDNPASGRGKIESSTIASNTGDASGAGTTISAGGVYATNSNVIRSSTIALNGPDSLTGDGANLIVNGGSASADLINTILADPRGGGDNCLK